jgi:hypothetical protein
LTSDVEGVPPLTTQTVAAVGHRQRPGADRASENVGSHAITLSQRAGFTRLTSLPGINDVIHQLPQVVRIHATLDDRR